MKWWSISKEGSGSKDTSRPLSSANAPILGAAPKLLPSNMDSRSFLSTKTPSFASSNVYSPMSLKVPVPFGGGVKVQGCDFIIIRWGFFIAGRLFLIFGSPLSASAVSRPIFEIKATTWWQEQYFYTPCCLWIRAKNIPLAFRSLAAESAPPHPKSGGWWVFTTYSGTRADQEVL